MAAADMAIADMTAAGLQGEATVRIGEILRNNVKEKLARDVVHTMQAHAPAGIELAFDAPDALPPIAADPDKLRQVLTNLVDNAVKYSPDGGRVRVFHGCLRMSQTRIPAGMI